MPQSQGGAVGRLSEPSTPDALPKSHAQDSHPAAGTDSRPTINAPLKLRIPRHPREGDHVPDILHTSTELHHTFKPQSESRMRHTAKPA